VGTVQVVVKRPLATAVKPRAVSVPAAESVDTSGSASVPDTSVPEVVDGVLATAQDAVEGLPPAVAAPVIPTPSALDPVRDALPDPLPVSSKKKGSSGGK
jgi:hypothetical protein